MDLRFPLSLDSAGRLETVDGVDETRQRAEMVLASQTGEWDLDLSYGVPWREILVTRPVQLGAARAVIIKALLAVPGLDSVDELVLTPQPDRTMIVTGFCTAGGVQFPVGV